MSSALLPKPATSATFSRKDAEVADLPLGDDIAFEFVLAGKQW